MSSWSDFLPAAGRLIAALWILGATLVLLLRQHHGRPRRRTVRLKGGPAREGPKSLARLLEDSVTSAFGRDRVAERLRGLGRDLVALERGQDDAGARAAIKAGDWEAGQGLVAYLERDWISGPRRRRLWPSSVPESHPEFLGQTETALRELEALRFAEKGDKR